ncbi:MAG: hypothetical protein N2Z70_00625 [Bdellovibrionaceae bacterium]|jgi:hypothetical protein|nr:hypothetical protein [Pseudobdellovibrionaceae bacterium]
MVLNNRKSSQNKHGLKTFQSLKDRPWLPFFLSLILGLLYACCAPAQAHQCRQVFTGASTPQYSAAELRWLSFLKSLQAEGQKISTHQRNDEANAHLSQWLAELNWLWDEMATQLILLKNPKVPPETRSMLRFQLESGLHFFSELLGSKDPRQTLQLLAKKSQRILDEWQEQNHKQGYIGFIPPETQTQSFRQNDAAESRGLDYIGFLPAQEAPTKTSEKPHFGFIPHDSSGDTQSTSQTPRPIGFIPPSDSSSRQPAQQDSSGEGPRSIGFTSELNQAGADVGYRLQWGYDTKHHSFVTVRESP